MGEESKTNNFQEIIDDITEQASSLILDWTRSNAGDISQWFSLMESLVSIIQNKYGKILKGIEKADVATNAIISLAQKLWDKYTNELSEAEIEDLRNGELKILVVIMDNPAILKASTSIFKQLLNYIDKDGDGEISQDECKMFWCCGNANVCNKKSNKKK